MKKIALTILSAICATCAAFGVAATNVEAVSAEALVELSATAIKKSTAQDKMLLATAIKNYECVYEVGYTGLEDVEVIQAETTKYYTEITTGSVTWTTEDIFGSAFADAGMIIWEVEYDPTIDYSFHAYAKYGTATEGGIMVNNPETVVAATERVIASDEILKSGLNILADWQNHYMYYWNGATTGIVADGNDLAIGVGQNGNAAGVGTTLYPSTIKALYDLGIKEIKFTLGMENGLYCAIFIDGDTGLNYLSGNAVNVDASNIHFYQNGANITINLEKLVGNATFMNTACTVGSGGLHFVVLTGSELIGEYVYKSATTITMSETTFVKMSAEDVKKNEAIAYLASAEAHYRGYYFGSTVGGDDFVVSDNNITISVKANNGGTAAGTTLYASTIKKLYDMGFKKITFTLAMEEGLSCGIYTNVQDNIAYQSGNSVFVDGIGYVYIYQSGSQVTIDLEALVNNESFMNMSCNLV